MQRRGSISSPTKNENPEYGRRIPVTLQSVIVSSNRGRHVKKPPPESVAYKVYTRRWFGLRRVDAKFDVPESSLGNNTPGLPGSPRRAPMSPRGKVSPRNNLVLSPRHINTSNNRPPSMPLLQDVFVAKPIAPQTYLKSLLQSRGYSTTAVKATECAYYNKVTQLQQASYGSFMVEVIRANDVAILRELLEVGLSPNASNAHSESIVHLACRMGFVDIVKTLLDFDCRLQISDDAGRTPLHEACWSATPCFDIVERILAADRYMLLVADARGRLPLNYVREENWSAFTRFLMKKKDDLFPDKLFGETSSPSSSSSSANNNRKKQNFVNNLWREKPNSSLIRHPKKHISIQMARLVAQGRMSPAEVEFLTKGVKHVRPLHQSDEEEEKLDSEADFADEDDDEEDEAEDDETNDDEEDDSSNGSCISFDEQEMADLLVSIGSIGPVNWT